MTKTVLLALACSLTTAVPADAVSPFEQALVQPDGYVVRAQNAPAMGRSVPMAGSQVAASEPLTVPPPGTTTYYPPTYGNPAGTPQGTVVQPFSDPNAAAYPAPITQDPWLGGTVSPAAPVAPNYGVFGPQPQRYGWSPRADVFWIPEADTTPDIGDVEILGVDVASEYRTPIGGAYTFMMTPEFNYRSVQGPSAGPDQVLPGSLYRFGLDLALQTGSPNCCMWELGFTPAIATDFEESPSDDAYQFDARFVNYWRVSPQWMWILGVTYWDRVDDMILPYAGAVWTPNDTWEFRLTFPKSRISYFVGTPNGVPTWLYAQAEYSVESYEIGLGPGLGSDAAKVEFEDIEVVGGIRWEAGWMTTFIEGGYVFEREVNYTAPGTDFEIDDQFIGRIGFRF